MYWFAGSAGHWDIIGLGKLPYFSALYNRVGTSSSAPSYCKKIEGFNKEYCCDCCPACSVLWLLRFPPYGESNIRMQAAPHEK
jgi:hypothetical protein